MIQQVEEFGTEFETLALSNREHLVDGEVDVIDRRPAANGSFCVSDLPKQSRIVAIERRARGTWRLCIVGSILGEAVGIEPVSAARLSINLMEWRQLVRLSGIFEECAVHQFVISGRSNANREAALIGIDT